MIKFVVGNKLSMIMQHKIPLYAAAGLIGLSGCAGASVSSERLPNIVYVFPDQFRKASMGFWNEEPYSRQYNQKPDPVHTPNLNAFAKQSLVLTEAVSTCPLSSPYRGMFLSGMYPHLSGVALNCNSDRPTSSLRTDLTCIGDVLKQAGYNTGYIGKYHCDYPEPNDPQRPGHYVDDKMPCWDAYTPPERRHGFDYWYSYGTFDVHKNPHYWDTDGNRYDPHEFSPKHEADMAVSFIKNERGQRDPDKPFALVVSMNPPHSPYSSLNDCREEDFRLYKDVPLSDLLVRPNVDWSLKKTRCAPYYFANVTAVDREFGRILQALSDAGLDDNTIVVFTSDHGETMCSHVEDPKNSPYSEAFDIPFLIRYPAKIRPGTDPILMGSPDIMPTLLGLAGLERMIPDGLQGINYASCLLGKTEQTTRPTSALYIRNVDGLRDKSGKAENYQAQARGLKTDRYTFVVYWDKKGEVKETGLFDNRTDPYQLINLPLTQRPDEVAALRKELVDRLRQIDDPSADLFETTR